MQANKRPRRPAMLSATQAENLVGDTDPAEDSAIAHTSAWALFAVGDDDFDSDAVRRLVETIRVEGIDVVAHMWSRSPEFTLPGALWRLYLLAQWCARDDGDAQALWEAGRRVLDDNESMAARLIGEELWDMQTLLSHTASVFSGQSTDDDIPNVLGGASRFMYVLVAGASPQHRWINEASDPLAHPVTTRTAAMLRTAEELGAAARRAALGTLD